MNSSSDSDCIITDRKEGEDCIIVEMLLYAFVDISQTKEIVSHGETDNRYTVGNSYIGNSYNQTIHVC